MGERTAALGDLRRFMSLLQNTPGIPLIVAVREATQANYPWKKEQTQDLGWQK